jgi:hypothetical protein
MFDAELCSHSYVEPLSGNPDLKPLSLFDGVRKPTELSQKFRRGVDLFNISIAFDCHVFFSHLRTYP